MERPFFINNYKPFYIQAAGDPRAWSTEVYGLMAKVNSFPILPIPKPPYEDDWRDENGGDEYVVTQFFETQELSVGFIVKVRGGEVSEKILRGNISDFFVKIRQGTFSIYDDYTGIGRRGVYYSGYEEGEFISREDYCCATFTVKFKIDDPSTVMYYNSQSGQITTAPNIVDDVPIWLPFIRNYKPFYIQGESDSVAWSTEMFGLIAKSNPFPVIPSVKAPYGNDWKDLDGDNSYVGVQFFEAQEISVKFYCKTTNGEDSEKTLRGQIWEFFNKIKNGWLCFYDDYTGIGRQRVRYAGYEEDSYISRGVFARAIFTVKFKVNDPLTAMFYDSVNQRITTNPIAGRSDLLGIESGDAYIITEEGLFIQVA